MPRPTKLVKAAGAGWSLCASTAPSTSMTSSLGPATWFQISIIARMNSAVLKAISDLKESAWPRSTLRRQSGTKTRNCQNAIFADAEVTDGHPLGTATVQIGQRRGASTGRPGLGTAFDANPMVYLPTGRPDMTPSPPMASSGVRRLPRSDRQGDPFSPVGLHRRALCGACGQLRRWPRLRVGAAQDVVQSQSSRCPQEGRCGA